MANTSEESLSPLINENKTEEKVTYHIKKNYRTLAGGELKCYTAVQKYVHRPKRTVYKGGKKGQPNKKNLRDALSSMSDAECEELINYCREYKLGKYNVPDESESEESE